MITVAIPVVGRVAIGYVKMIIVGVEGEVLSGTVRTLGYALRYKEEQRAK